MIVCSSGGHLTQLLALRPWWERTDRCWVSFDTADAIEALKDERLIVAHHPTTRNIPNLLRNLRLALRTLRSERPDVGTDRRPPSGGHRGGQCAHRRNLQRSRSESDACVSDAAGASCFKVQFRDAVVISG